MSHLRIFGSRAWARIPPKRRRDLESKIKECIFVGYSKYSKGYKMINMSTQRVFIERSVQFEEENMPTTEITESYLPPPTLNVGQENKKDYDYHISYNYYLISDPNTPTIPNSAAKTIHAAGKLDGNPSDPKRTTS